MRRSAAARNRVRGNQLDVARVVLGCEERFVLDAPFDRLK
jgi:hypothetical protein